MQQAADDTNANVVPLLRRPLSGAERTRQCRARKKLKELARDAKRAAKKKPATRDAKPTVTLHVTTAAPLPPRDAPQPVDLIALRRDIWAWVRAHQEVDGRPAVERRQRLRDRVAQMSFLTVAVAFYVFLAYAAAAH
jgi:hypothetical protein